MEQCPSYLSSGKYHTALIAKVIGNHLVVSTTAVDMGRVRTQLDRRALSCFHQRCIFDHKIYSRKKGNKYLLMFVAQTEVLHNTIADRVDAYPLSSGYLGEAYSMVNHMLVVS